MPNIKYYYWASQLRTLIAWLTNDEETGWMKIEQNACPSIALAGLPFLTQINWKKLKSR